MVKLQYYYFIINNLSLFSSKIDALSYTISVNTGKGTFYVLPTRGKLYVRLVGNGFQHEVQLTPHSVPLKMGSFYSYVADVPYEVNNIASVSIKYKRQNVLSSEYINVERITVSPNYLPQDQKLMNTKTFCAGKSIPIKNEVWFIIANRC